jgi:hypothetical protein
MNWNRISLFKLPNRHKRFDYVPRYYDADKEAIQRKIDQANREAGLTATSNHSREIEFRSQIQSKWGNSEYKSASMRSNIRLIVILGLLLIAVYYIFIGLDLGGMMIDTQKNNWK